MRLTYDPDADAAYLTLGDSPVPDGGVSRMVHSIRTPSGTEMAVDFDDAGHLLGVEILAASRVVAPTVLAQATQITPGGPEQFA